MISLRKADFRSYLEKEQLSESCTQFLPLIDKVSEQGYVALVTYVTTPMPSEVALLKSILGVDDIAELERCGVLALVKNLHDYGVNNLSQIKEGYSLQDQNGNILYFLTKEARENVKEQMESNMGRWTLEGADEDTLNGQVVYLGSYKQRIADDSKYSYVIVNPGDGANSFAFVAEIKGEEETFETPY